jgi:phenylalanyl-tRNA synthetase beta chain
MITDLIGLEIPAAEMKGYFDRLGLNVTSETEQGCSVQIPPHRLDLTRPVDLVEEVARLHGLDRIPARTPQARIVHGAKDRELRWEKRIWSHLATRGFQETLTYSLTSIDALNRLDPRNESSRVLLPNPISQDQSVLRTSLLPQLVQTLAFNRSRQVEALAVFEAGKRYLKSPEGVQESVMVALGLMGPTRRAALKRQQAVDPLEAFLNLKGEFEILFSMLGCQEAITFAASDDATFAPGQAAEILFNGAPCGRLGLLNPAEREAGKFSGPIALGEVDLLCLLPRDHAPHLMQPIPDQPAVTRDVALMVDISCRHQDVLDLINQQRPRELEDVMLFDLFTGEKLGENRKSLAYRFTYRHPKKTLTDKAVEKMHRRIEDRLMAELPADIEGRS